jgi:hypothetical protein
MKVLHEIEPRICHNMCVEYVSFIGDSMELPFLLEAFGLTFDNKQTFSSFLSTLAHLHVSLINKWDDSFKVVLGILHSF